MYRKAGIIVGVVLIVVALAVVMITNGVRMKEANEPDDVVVEQPVDTSSGDSSVDNSGSNTSDSNSSSDNTSSDEQTIAPIVQTPVKVVEEKNEYFEYNESNLKDLDVSEDITEVMVVSSKKVVLFNPANSDSYQFVHACEFLTSSNLKLTYYISSSTYDSVEIGEQLRVTYRVYTNANDLDMPVIVKVDRLNNSNT